MGNAPDDNFGFDIDLSSDGSSLAVGAFNANGSVGHVKVFENNCVESYMQWNTNSGNINNADWFDLYMALSPTGSALAVGELHNSKNHANLGQIQIINLQESSNNYTQQGYLMHLGTN